MIAISECESGLGADILNEASGAKGILMEMPEVAAAYGHNYALLSDAWYAAKAAYDLWADSGFSPWIASQQCWGY